MSNRFEEIYDNNDWGHGSGEGSLDIQTVGYREFIQDFLANKKITSVVDMGCGDWQFSQLINWSEGTYQGFDVVPSVISANNEKFAQGNVSFELYSGKPADLPAADLLIVKDVLQHLPNQTVIEFLPHLSKYKYALITNCTNPQQDDAVNDDILIGDCRPLDLRLPPFNLSAELAYSFHKNEVKITDRLKTFFRGYPKWKKLVLLVDRSRHDVPNT